MTTSMAPESSGGLAGFVYGLLRRIPTWALWLVVVIWTIPSFSLFVNGFRGRSDQRNNGFWTQITDFVGITDINEGSWTTGNYESVFDADSTASLVDSIGNSFAVSIPATIIPIAIATFAAYAFAWIDFKGREWLFIFTVSLLAIPLQVALIPLLQLFVGGAHLTIPFMDKTVTLLPDMDLAGSTTAVWLTHTGFAMPFAIFLIHNYLTALPRDIFEAARIDGADHFTIFWRIVLPLSVPVIAAFAIFQFLWTWNDFLIVNTMAGSNPDAFTSTIRLANLAGDFGEREHLLSSAAFVQIIFPLIVFFSLQRYFVRGLLAGSVKG